MHSCVAIPELYEAILGHLEQDSSSNSTPLLSPGLTCKYMLEGALDVIWRRKSIALSALMCIIPRKFQDATCRTLGDPKASDRALGTIYWPIRELSDAEFERVMYYTKRIRGLTIENDTDVATLRTLFKSRCFRTGSFVPQLTTFGTQFFPGIVSPEAAHHLSFLLGDSIVNLKLSYNNEYQGSRLLPLHLCSAIKRRCINASKMTINITAPASGQDDFGFAPEIESVILSLSHLTYLEVSSWLITPRVLEHVARLPTFAALGGLIPTEPMISNLISLGPPLFKTLTDLKMEVNDWPSSIQTFDLLPKSLLSLKLTSWGRFDGTSFKPHLIAALLSKVSNYEHLEELHILIRLSYRPPTANNLHVFDPIFSLSKLRKLVIKSWLLEHADREWLLRISDAFPLLESLRLNVVGFSLRVSRLRLTMQDLLPFLQKSTQLQEIEVCVVCSPFPLDTISRLKASRLRRAIFKSCPIGNDVQSVLHCILAMFPSAVEILGHLDFMERLEYRPRWEELSRCLVGAGRLDLKTFDRCYPSDR